MNQLVIKADEATVEAEEHKKKVKTLEQENLQKEQEITSLQHKNGLLEAEVEKLEGQIKDAKALGEEGAQHGTQNEALQRRLQLLEDEAEEADKNLRETNDKYVPAKKKPYEDRWGPWANKLTHYRLRQTDVKAGHFERKVQALEQDRDQWEQKFEEMAKKYAAVQKELEDFQAEIGNI
jgi:tropomyosin